jgi:L-asparaginase
LSDVNITRMPAEVLGVRLADGRLGQVAVPIKDRQGDLVGSAIPRVTVVKDGSYLAEDFVDDPAREVDLIALINDNLAHAPLAGFVVEGLSPYGTMTAQARHQLMLRAVHSGMPVARVGRGNNDGFTPGRDRLIGGHNLTATKARILLMACLMKLGSPPPAADPDHPTAAELTAIRRKIAEYQAIFDTH